MSFKLGLVDLSDSQIQNELNKSDEDIFEDNENDVRDSKAATKREKEAEDDGCDLDDSENQQGQNNQSQDVEEGQGGVGRQDNRKDQDMIPGSGDESNSDNGSPNENEAALSSDEDCMVVTPRDRKGKKKRRADTWPDKTDLPSKQGRPQSAIRDHFETKRDASGKFLTFCRYCKLKVSNQAQRLNKHLAKCIKKRLPVEPSKSAQSTTSDVPGSSSEVQESSESGCSQESASAFSDSIKLTPALKQPLITKHITKGDSKRQEEAILKMGKFIYSSNLPFRVAENQQFQDFVHFLNPSFKIPSHDVIGSSTLDSVHKEILGEQKKLLTGKKCVLLQDGWSTNQNEPVIAHCVYTPEATHFLAAENVGAEVKSAEFCFSLFEKEMEKAELEFNVEVLGLVTDNCSTMIALQRLVRKKYPNMNAYGCNAHLFNLLGKRFTPNELQDNIQFVQRYFRNHHKASGMLKEKKGGRAVICNSIRWNSQTDMFKNFVKNQHLYLEISRKLTATTPEADKEKLDKLRLILNTPSLYEDTERAIQILEPIAKALDKVQKKDSNLADAVSSWLSLLNQLPHSITSDNYFNKQFKLAMTPVAIATYMFDPRYKDINLPENFKEIGFEYLKDKNPYYLIIYDELCNPDSSFFYKTFQTNDVISSFSPSKWWKNAAKSAVPSYVTNFVEGLFALPAGTGNIERAFSTMGAIITKQRNQLDVGKAGKLCTIINHYKLLRQEN